MGRSPRIDRTAGVLDIFRNRLRSLGPETLAVNDPHQANYPGRCETPQCNS
jgi:hypothetical protein